jgi:hypothetical protein
LGEVRHSIVHRRVSVDPQARQIVGHDSSGAAIRPVPFAQQQAFGLATLRVVNALLTGVIERREESDLHWLIDQLTEVHGGAVIGGVQLGKPGTIVVDPLVDGDDWLIDVRAAREVVLPIRPDNPLYDLAIHSPQGDGRVLVGPLEEAPEGELRINPAAPPGWLNWLSPP